MGSEFPQKSAAALSVSPPVPLAVKAAHFLALIVSIYNIIVIAVFRTHNDVIDYSPDMNIEPFIVSLLPSNAVAFLWSAASLLLSVALEKRIHLGWHVGFSTFTWVFLLITGLMATIFCEIIATNEGLMYASCVLTLFNAILQFVSMTWACRKLDVFNRANKNGDKTQYKMEGLGPSQEEPFAQSTGPNAV